MSGGKNKKPLGYTIIEVMIVLVVSGLMFVIAATFINGKTANAAFDSAIKQMASQMQNTISDVTSGRYSDIPLDCSLDLSGDLSLSLPASGQTQATNPACVFFGKYIHFAGVKKSNYEEITLGSSTAAPGLDNVIPITQYANGAGSIPNPQSIDLTKQEVIPGGLEFKELSVFQPNGVEDKNLTGFGIAINASQATLTLPEALSFQLGYNTTDSIASALSDQALTTTIQSSSGTGLKQATGVAICFSNSSNSSQLADVFIGVNSSDAEQTELTARAQYIGTGDNCP